mmetsp:Transcript_9330/g.28264  ORF Transcript_9330/g.28264 Transcript_9330/m.28264 type:complete len:200 (-) Transcript_9330:492-1091(-)
MRGAGGRPRATTRASRLPRVVWAPSASVPRHRCRSVANASWRRGRCPSSLTVSGTTGIGTSQRGWATRAAPCGTRRAALARAPIGATLPCSRRLASGAIGDASRRPLPRRVHRALPAAHSLPTGARHAGSAASSTLCSGLTRAHVSRDGPPPRCPSTRSVPLGCAALRILSEAVARLAPPMGHAMTAQKRSGNPRLRPP